MVMSPMQNYLSETVDLQISRSLEINHLILGVMMESGVWRD